MALFVTFASDSLPGAALHRSVQLRQGSRAGAPGAPGSSLAPRCLLCMCVCVYYCTRGGPHNLRVASAAGPTFATHIGQNHICSSIWASMWLSIFMPDLFSCLVYLHPGTDLSMSVVLSNGNTSNHHLRALENNMEGQKVPFHGCQHFLPAMVLQF